MHACARHRLTSCADSHKPASKQQPPRKVKVESHTAEESAPKETSQKPKPDDIESLLLYVTQLDNPFLFEAVLEGFVLVDDAL